MIINGFAGFDPSLYGFQTVQERSTAHSRDSTSGASTVDTVNLSLQSQNVAAMVTAMMDGTGGWCGAKTLTSADKTLVKDVTGWDIDADPYGKTASTEAFQLAGRLNLDRFAGDVGDTENGLVGEVNQAYISKLIDAQMKGQDIMPLQLLYRVQAYLSSQPNGTVPA